MIVQFRPPITGTANVYGNRRNAPTPLGTATSQSACDAVRAKPDAAGAPSGPAVICTTTMLQSNQTEKPTCSAKIENMRFRRAIGFPTVDQNSGILGAPVLDPVLAAAGVPGLGGRPRECQRGVAVGDGHRFS